MKDICRAALVVELRRQVREARPEDDNFPWRQANLNLANSLERDEGWPSPVPSVVVYDRGKPASVTLTMTPEEAQAVFDRLYVYDADPGYMDRYAITRRLLESGAVTVDDRG